MNRSTPIPSAFRLILFSCAGRDTPALQLEGSLAGVARLAPVIPFSLGAAFPQPVQRRGASRGGPSLRSPVAAPR
jgi:hypothetical protein